MKTAENWSSFSKVLEMKTWQHFERGKQSALHVFSVHGSPRKCLDPMKHLFLHIIELLFQNVGVWNEVTCISRFSFTQGVFGCLIFLTLHTSITIWLSCHLNTIKSLRKRPTLWLLKVSEILIESSFDFWADMNLLKFYFIQHNLLQLKYYFYIAKTKRERSDIL